MISKDPGMFWRSVITVIGLAVATVMALAVPAWAHPVFSNDEPGFPNPMGGTGGPGQTPPYPAGSRPTLNMFLPFEQDGVVFHGAENTTVDVRVTIPAAWANPVCGPARTSPPVGYRQMGTVVPGWSCAIETVSGHQVLHWTGPQVSSAQTHDDSAQFFTFQATMPSPATQTSYGAAGGPEGVHVKQVYANGATSLWTPPNDSPAGETAPGVVRTVAAAPAPPPTPASVPTPGTTPPGGTTHGSAQSATAPGTVQGGATAPSPPPAPAQHNAGGLTSPPAAGAPATGSTAQASPPSPDALTDPAATSAASSPGVQSSPSSVEALTQRNTAASRGLGWPGWVGITLGAVMVITAVILVIRRRQRAA
jgi:hypothetical protein